VTNKHSLFNATLDLLQELTSDVADGKVESQGYNVARDGRKFVYTIKVDEPYRPEVP
jgi:hypothetical protein